MKDLNYFKRLHEAEEDEKDEEITDTEETDVDVEETDDETSDEDTEDEPETEEEKEKFHEEEFVNMFTDESFTKAFKNEVKQYVTEKLLDDEFNSFTVLPYVEFVYKDENYGVNIEFESAVSINIGEDGKVVESDVPDVDVIKYKTPLMDNVTLLEDEMGKETIGLFVKEAIEEIKNVPK